MTAPVMPDPAAHGRPGLSLNGAQSYLTTAADALDGWYARQNTPTHNYVAEGHEAIHFIDQLLRELYRVRAALVGEIRTDEDERAERIDRLIARCRADREARATENHMPDTQTAKASPAPGITPGAGSA
jgi:hypothetical protein